MVKAVVDSFSIANPTSNPISIISKTFLSENKNLKPATHRRKEKQIFNFIKWSGNPDIAKITKKIAGDFITELIQRKNPAPATLRNVKSDIGSLFSSAEGRGYIEQNPFKNIKLPNIDKISEIRIPWSNENVITFLNHTKISHHFLD